MGIAQISVTKLTDAKLWVILCAKVSGNPFPAPLEILEGPTKASRECRRCVASRAESVWLHSKRGYPPPRRINSSIKKMRIRGVPPKLFTDRFRRQASSILITTCCKYCPTQLSTLEFSPWIFHPLCPCCIPHLPLEYLSPNPFPSLGQLGPVDIGCGLSFSGVSFLLHNLLYWLRLLGFTGLIHS